MKQEVPIDPQVLLLQSQVEVNVQLQYCGGGGVVVVVVQQLGIAGSAGAAAGEHGGVPLRLQLSALQVVDVM